MEEICRSLQKENRRLKDESQKLSQSEQQRREELSSKFESTIFEIRSRMEEDADARQESLDEAEVGRTKDRLRTFVAQYEVREKHFNSLLKSKELEYQLLEARYDQQRQLMEQEALKVSTLQTQLEAFIAKFKSVEDTLSKSNELFHNFRAEIESSSKKMKSLEQLCRALQTERNDLRSRLQRYESVDVMAPETVDVD